MIDYLEQLFIRQGYMEEGKEGENPSPFREKTMPRSMGELEPVQTLPVSRFRDEAAWQQEAAQRLEQALIMPEVPARKLAEEPVSGLRQAFLNREEPGSETYSAPLAYHGGQGEREEDLEHRLRRNSRRYDSGFFLY